MGSTCVTKALCMCEMLNRCYMPCVKLHYQLTKQIFLKCRNSHCNEVSRNYHCNYVWYYETVGYKEVVSLQFILLIFMKRKKYQKHGHWTIEQGQKYTICEGKKVSFKNMYIFPLPIAKKTHVRDNEYS